MGRTIIAQVISPSGLARGGSQQKRRNFSEATQGTKRLQDGPALNRQSPGVPLAGPPCDSDGVRRYRLSARYKDQHFFCTIAISSEPPHFLSEKEMMTEDDLMDHSGSDLLPKLNTSDGCGCPVCGIHDWIKFGKTCYKFFPQKLTFARAEMFCRHRIRGGRLASVHSRSQNNQLNGLFQAQPQLVWLGGLYLQQDKIFIWSDGSEFNYQNWGKGQPDFYGKYEHCVQMHATGTWNDLSCASELAFMCEYHLSKQEQARGEEKLLC
ncbi:C-type lectin-like isoform X1 [Lissotriton helveticus]